MSRVFVVIPTYNAEAYLEPCLASLTAQTFQNWQAIVINDGSSDSSLQVAQNYAKQEARIQVETFPNGGMATARNRGIEYAPESCEFFLFLDNDDFLEQDALEVLVRRLDAVPEAAAAYGLPHEVNAEGKSISPDISRVHGFVRKEIFGSTFRQAADDSPTNFSSFVISPNISTTGQVLIRAAALRSVGLFDSQMVPSDDWDMWLRLSLHGDFVLLRQFVINKRAHGNNASGNAKKMAEAGMRIQHKFIRSPLLTSPQRKLIRLGYLHSCQRRILWARMDLKERRRLHALKNLYRAGRLYAVFLRSSVYLGRRPQILEAER